MADQATCQVKRYDGSPCGRPLFEEERCIFHAKSSEQKKREFSKAFWEEYERQKKEDPVFDFSSFLFPDSIKFSGTRFDKSTYFADAEFLGELTSFLRAEFSGRETIFRESKFSGDKTEFLRSRFSGKKISFRNARFSGKKMGLLKTEFLGEETTFGGAEFSGEQSSFDETEFSGKKTSFREAKFSSEACSFHGTKFHGQRVTFENAQFSGKETSFSGTEFSGALTSFEDVKFSCEIVSFQDAKFSGKEVSFLNAEFSGKETSFLRAEFSGKEASFLRATFSGAVTAFHDARFRGEGISFHNTVFQGQELSFLRAEFSGEVVSFLDAKFTDEETSFQDAKFAAKKVHFGWAQFASESTSFEGAEFLGEDTSFVGAIFSGKKIRLFNSYFEKLEGLFESIKYPQKLWKKAKNKIRDFRFTLGTSAANRYPIINRMTKDAWYLAEFKNRHPIIHFIWKTSSNCGRSISLWAFWSFVIIILFGAVYADYSCPRVIKWMDRNEWMEKINPEMRIDQPTVLEGDGLEIRQREKSWFSPYYFSIVTFTTLGFGDITPVNTAGEIWLALEVILGYVMLGGLISIFAVKLARRS